MHNKVSNVNRPKTQNAKEVKYGIPRERNRSDEILKTGADFTPINLKKKKDINVNPNQASSFAQLLQSDPSSQGEKIQEGQGTVAPFSSLNKCREKSSSFKISFKDFGSSDVSVVEENGKFFVTIDLEEKSKLPSNPLLLKKIVEKQLGKELGATISVRFI